MEQAYLTYFSQQAGGGESIGGVGNVYQASFSQQNGHGCCGVGRVLSAVATPLIAKGVRVIGEEGANAAFGFYRDVQQDGSLAAVGTAARKRIAEVGRNLKRRAAKALTGRGTKRRRRTDTTKKTKKKRSTTSNRSVKKRKSNPRNTPINRKKKSSKAQKRSSTRRSRSSSTRHNDIFS